MNKVLEGDLTRFEVPDVLSFLEMGRRTGVLVLERPEQESKLFVSDGRPVFANTTKDELRFGPLLVRFGKVAPDLVERLLARRAAGAQRIGQMLLSERVLTEAELASFLKVQVSEVIFDTFAWHEGLFTFFDGVAPPATAVTLDMDLKTLIMEGVRRIDQEARLDLVFPDLTMAVEALANPERVKHSATLTPEEWKVFFLVDGRRSLADICRLSANPDERATLQILHNLLVAKLVMLVPPVPSPPPAAAPAPAAVGHHTMRAPEIAAAAAPAPPVPVSVEFSSGMRPRRPEDDTKEIVSKKAVQYLANAQKLTVSRLVLIKDGNETSFPLTRDTYTLGRHRNNDIVISDPKVSSFHARIDRSSEGFVLVDLKSRNGSFVNGKKIESGVLKTGDEVRLGTARLVYRVDYTSVV
jgi:hypothetical protein